MIDTLKTLWNTFNRYRWHIATLVVLGFASAILEGIGINAAVPLLSFLVGGGSVPADGVSQGLQAVAGWLSIPFTFKTLLIFIFTLFVLRAVSVVLFGYIRGWISTDFFIKESKGMMRSMLAASWPFLLKQKIGLVQNSLVRDIQRAANLLDSTSQSIQSFTGALMYMAVAVSISPRTTLFTFLGGGAFLLLVRPLLGRIRLTAEEMASTEKDVSQSLAQQIIGMKTIKAAGAESDAFKEMGVLMNVLRRLQVRIAFIKAVGGAMFQPFTLFFIAVAFYVSYHSPGFSLVSFGATLYLIQKIFVYFDSGMSSLQSMNEAAPYARQMTQFGRELRAHEEGTAHGSEAFSFAKEIRFENVSLQYGEGEEALKDMNIAIRRGHMLALIGPSGAGKTSLVDLLLRLFEPSSGRLLVDGVDAKSVPLADWRSRFAYVSQDPFLFNGTIAENICFFREDIAQDEIEAAARQANIYDFITTLPEGFATVVGDRGVLLSGGQRQRIVLARALACKPDILVLDEATSALDTESERLIQESIHALHGKVTVLVIAHRLSTIENADEIVVLDRGRVVEQGSPQELLKSPNSYYTRHSRVFENSR